jgi:hypothetical protein
MQKTVTVLMFVGDQCGKAEEAMNFYTSLLKHSEKIFYITQQASMAVKMVLSNTQHLHWQDRNTWQMIVLWNISFRLHPPFPFMLIVKVMKK